MLYITTRNPYDASTTPKSLTGDRGTDGGLYLPFQMPAFSSAELSELSAMSFGQCVARILNLFFACRLTGWDVEFSIGRYPAKVRDIGNRILAAELWHNSRNCYERLQAALTEKILQTSPDAVCTSWVRIAIRIAVLFGIYGQMLRAGSVKADTGFDVTLTTGDFSCAMAVYYAKTMGLPVENTVCGCNENGAVWELLHLGEVRTDVSQVKTDTPLADIALPQELERLICASLGSAEARRFGEICARRGVYAPVPGMLEHLRKGIFAAVVSKERLQALIPNVYSTSSYLLGPYSALAYGGLLDYRTRNRQNRPALLIADRSPACEEGYVASAMRLTTEKLRELY